MSAAVAILTMPYLRLLPGVPQRQGRPLDPWSGPESILHHRTSPRSIGGSPFTGSSVTGTTASPAPRLLAAMHGEGRANLLGFFKILLEWDGADQLASPANDVKPRR